MKIVCGSCQAKYSIADEKVAGKVFKIRCKRCSEVIVVRGDQDGSVEAPAAAAAGYDTGADAIWHVVINGEQAGPYSPGQLGEMLSNGQVDWEAYVWCEGFDNWAAMRDVPDLVAAITGQGQAAQSQPMASMAQPSMGADPFADDGGGGGGGLFADPAPAPARSNLFGGGASHDSPFDGGGGGGGVVASAPSPRVSAEQAMTGARNENSVLFSLKNLQALATGGSAPAASGGGPAPMMSAGNRPGFAGGDGSGLIDIRALASATGMGDSRRDDNEKDALLSLGSNQTGAFGALGSPMLAPVANDDDGGKKGLYIAIIGGFALLAAAGIVAAVLLRPQAPGLAGVAAPTAPPPPAAAVAAAANPQAAPAAPAEAPSEGELAAKKQAEAASGGEEKRSSGGSTRRRESGGDSKAMAANDSDLLAKPTAGAPKVDEKAKPKGGSSSIDELLDGAIGGGSSAKAAPKKEAAASAPDPNLPEKPSRDDVISAMNGVKDAVTACGNGAGGVAFASVSVSGKTGRVTSAEITGITGEVGSCIARVVRKASFPKFSSDSFQVKYPFRL